MFLIRIIEFLFTVFPIDKRKVLFMSYYGEQYGCNPKYISQYICSKGKDLKCVWAFTEPERHDVPGVVKVKYISLRFLYEWATCGTIVTNYRLPLYLTKRRGQKYIQTWHSSLRLKMIGLDAYDMLTDDYKTMIPHDSAQIDLLISGCAKSTEIFRRAFGYDGEILECGTPRNDMFINGEKNARQKVYDTYGIKVEKKVILYAPTFRKDYSLRYYDIDFETLVQSVCTTFGGEWVVLLRLHPHLVNLGTTLQRRCRELTIDASKYDDIQELLAASDILITDYSSLMFDYIFTGNPVFLYTPDLEEYVKKERNLYFDIKALPFEHACSNTELNELIQNFDERKYKLASERFQQKVGSFEQGTACAWIVNYIKTK
jgi:CDP-glycerol glycerophosphotransferase